ncbi:MAG: ribonuclease HI family protein [bacterium]
MIEHKGIAIIDGAVKGNPGKAGIGVVLKNSNGEKVLSLGKFIGKATNNEAEWLAFIEALRLAKKKFQKLEVITDSQLLVRQWNGLYKIRAQNLLKLQKKAKKLAEELKELRVKQGTRSETREAHDLANKAIKDDE